MRTFNFGAAVLEPFEIGASLMAILAFPSPEENDACTDAAAALCAGILRKTMAAYPDDAVNWRNRYPEYAAIDEHEMRNRLHTLPRRLRDRMIASRMSLGYLLEGQTGKLPSLPEKIKRWSINELSKLVVGQSGESDPENVEHRVWRYSLPVIHLAAAFQFVAKKWNPDEEGLPYLLDDEIAHLQIIAAAQYFEEIVLANPSFRIDPEELVRIRLN